MTTTASAPSSQASPLLFQDTRPDEARPDVARRAEHLAERLAERSRLGQSAQEASAGAQMARLMEDAPGKAFLFAMVDEVFRSHNPASEARRWRGMLSEFGVPLYPAAQDRWMMRLGALGSRFLPQLVMPLVAARMRAETARVILDGEPQALRKYLQKRRGEGFRINLNHLGEAVLGEEEAAHRLESVLDYLGKPEVSYVSIKISALFSQINLLAWDETLAQIKERLRRLYRAALPAKKFVNLDMEEYRDLALTIAAFRQVLDEPEFLSLSAGIVLQAYLPDSWAAQRELVGWARGRVERGGAPIKIRLVKGANLAMEKVEAELHGWNAAPYASKAEADANFRRMLEWGCQGENARVARLGVASHNLFDVALALTLREEAGTEELVEIEMLEGMANHQARAVRDQAGGLLLYAPVVRRDDFLSALAYLIRRLDENTAPENFLHDSFDLAPATPAWERQAQAFRQGWHERHQVSDASRRALPAVDADSAPRFENEPDSDWTQRSTRDALWRAVSGWKAEPLPSLEPLDAVLERARAAQTSWQVLGAPRRAEILRRAAQVMAAQRFQSIACMRAEAKKAVPEADAEASEAIDFARYYAAFEVPDGIQAEPVGVVVVAPPWNFPYAIPAGGVLSALAAGNSVILKPAPEVVQVAHLLARQLWEAGVPRDALQFFPCEDGDTGRALICDGRVSAVILTGALETARLFQSWRPSLPLLAETSGKNALVITAQADREAAIKDLVKSAFGHAGQKCSASSLAIIEAEVYDSPAFRRQLRDAASSLHVGPSTNARSIVTPTMREPHPALHRALDTLEAGEEWLLEPRQIGDDPCLWSPGIKLGVRAGSWFHQTECFGPVMGLMRADSLAQAIEWQNATPFGLTAGLHSLDHEEIAMWRDAVQAGNLYINRATTGAIVERQPFGGWKASSIGPGAKAGGPNYCFNFCRLSDASDAAGQEAEASYRAAWREHFSVSHDPSALPCESNIFRYRPCRGVVLRLQSRDEEVVRRARLAAEITHVPLHISVADEESAADFAARLPELAQRAEFLRTIEAPGDQVLGAAYEAGLNWINAPVTASGRLELRFWLREQAVSQTLHRYGQRSEWKPSTRRAG